MHNARRLSKAMLSKKAPLGKFATLIASSVFLLSANCSVLANGLQATVAPVSNSNNQLNHVNFSFAANPPATTHTLHSSTVSTSPNLGPTTSSQTGNVSLNAGVHSSVAGTVSPTSSGSQHHFVAPFLNTGVNSLSSLLPQSTASSANQIQLDLASSKTAIVLGASLIPANQSISINVGGSSESFHAGSHVTAAEYVAIQQVLSSGSQSLVLGKNGAASGGSFSINALGASQLDNLVVPKNVTAIDIRAP